MMDFFRGLILLYYDIYHFCHNLARGLVGSDDSGLSDAFARVLFLNNAGDTKIIWETRSPSWDQTMIFYDLVIWGDAEQVYMIKPESFVSLHK